MAAKSKKASAKTSKPKAPKPEADSEADAFMASLDHPLKADIEAVRKIILEASPAVADGIKWNSLSFRKADWFATVHLRSRDQVELVFHTGAKTKDNPEIKISDPKGLIKWLATDRALVTLGTGNTLETNTSAFKAIVKAWLKYV
jgi:hypothetical protein